MELQKLVDALSELEKEELLEKLLLRRAQINKSKTTFLEFRENCKHLMSKRLFHTLEVYENEYIDDYFERDVIHFRNAGRVTQEEFMRLKDQYLKDKKALKNK